jgi:large subunit ribosomal protein L13
MDTKAFTIDASGKPVGRIATEAALALRGKNAPSFECHIAPEVKVEIVNADKMSIYAPKLKQKKYTHYTGYSGGLRQARLEEVLEKKGPEEVIRKAVYGMLPGNKLRPVMMKNLIVHRDARK